MPPGIIGLLTEYKESERCLDALCNTVLTGPSSLTRAKREVIATYVSSGNECYFCTNAHAAAARHLLERPELMNEVLEQGPTAAGDAKLQALLVVAGNAR